MAGLHALPRYVAGRSALANEYDELKVALAKRFPDDRASYTLAKGRFIEKVLRGAE
jgi:GrpB-like predicted nucleotidyltransferase (UPF0157 family)